MADLPIFFFKGRSAFPSDKSLLEQVAEQQTLQELMMVMVMVMVMVRLMMTMITADMQKDNFLTQKRFMPKYFYPKKCLNLDKSEFTT